MSRPPAAAAGTELDTSREARVEVVVFADAAELYEEATRRFFAAARSAITARGRCLAVLTGGSTIPPVYEHLGSPLYADEIDWSRVHVFWSDERCVAPDDPRSNYRMVRETLLAHVPVPADRIHRMKGEDPDRDRAAAEYEREIHRVAATAEPRQSGADTAPGPEKATTVESNGPRFDFAFLGLGADCHVASLFPESPLVDERERWAAAVHADRMAVPNPTIDRLTLTPPALNAAREIVFVVTGANKARVVRAVLKGPRDYASVPAQVVAPPGGTVTWLLDSAAAAELPHIQL